MRTAAVLAALLAACGGSARPCGIEGGRIRCPGGTAELPATCAIEQVEPGRRRVSCPAGTVEVEDEDCAVVGASLVCGDLVVPLSPAEEQKPAIVHGTATRFGLDGDGVRVRIAGSSLPLGKGGGFALAVPVGLHGLEVEAAGYGTVSLEVLALPGQNEVGRIDLLPGGRLAFEPTGSAVQTTPDGRWAAVEGWHEGKPGIALFDGESDAPRWFGEGAHLTWGYLRDQGMLVDDPEGVRVVARPGLATASIPGCTAGEPAGPLVICSDVDGYSVHDPWTAQSWRSLRRPQVSASGRMLLVFDGTYSIVDRVAGTSHEVPGEYDVLVSDRLLLVDGALWAIGDGAPALIDVPRPIAVTDLAGSTTLLRHPGGCTLWNELEQAEIASWTETCAALQGAGLFVLVDGSGLRVLDAAGDGIATWSGATGSLRLIAPTLAIAGASSPVYIHLPTGTSVEGPRWNDGYAEVSPDGTRALVTNLWREVVLVDPPAGISRPVLEGDGGRGEIHGFAGDDLVHVKSRVDGVLRRIDLRDGAVLPLGPGPLDVAGLADGSILAPGPGALRRIAP